MWETVMTNGEENECHGGESVWLWVFFFFCLVLFLGGGVVFYWGCYWLSLSNGVAKLWWIAFWSVVVSLCVCVSACLCRRGLCFLVYSVVSCAWMCATAVLAFMVENIFSEGQRVLWAQEMKKHKVRRRDGKSGKEFTLTAMIDFILLIGR